MAPTLRSSTNDTPNGKSSKEPTSNNTTPRKAPICTKCKQPRAGHPRSGCPSIDSPTKKESPKRPIGKDITDSLGSLHLQSPSRDPLPEDDTRATIRQRRRSYAAAALDNTQISVRSLDTESQEVMNTFRMFDSGPRDDEGVQLQETSTPTRSKRERVKMPCSLSSPSPSPSFESIKLEDSGAQAEPVESTQPDLQPVAYISSQPSILSIPSLQPLARSMSMEQRESFLSGLNTLSAATAHTIPREVIHSACFEAVKLGFHARIVVGNTNDPEARLVLGRNEAAVKRLCDELESEQKKPQGGNFRAVAGGAVVGAVGAIAGLAFS